VSRAEWDELSKLLTRAREEAGLSQSEVARRLNRRQAYVWKIENGQQRIDPLELIDLCRVMGNDASTLFAEFEKAVAVRRQPDHS
jgi:transcriptional regulator with XRE-family HTH domain